MRILPVIAFPFARTQNAQPVNKQPQKISFTSGSDVFQPGSILDREISDLKEVFNTEIYPIIEKNRDRFNQTGKIGYDSQEKLKLIQSMEQKLFDKKFNATDNKFFKEVEQVTGIYEKYKENIREYELTSKNIKNSTMYNTPELLKVIDKSKPKIYQGEEEFKKIQPLYQQYNDTKQHINEDLDEISIKNMPKFAKKAADLREQNTTAVLIILNSGYSDMLKLSNDAEALFRDYEEQSQPAYKLLERAERLNCDVQRFQNNNPELTGLENDETDNFLFENNNYESTNLSKEEIENTYNLLFKEAEMLIDFHTTNLYNYYKSNPVKLSPRIIDKTLKAQERANRNINKLLQKEKQAFYEKSNEEFFNGRNNINK